MTVEHHSVPSTTPRISHTSDVIVIGGGLAGLAAAVAATETGHSVTLVERAGDGGSTAMSGGWFAFSDTPHQREAGIVDSPESFFADMWSTSGERADPALLWAYIDNQGSAYQWLVSEVPHIGALKLSSGQTVARSHQFDVHAFTERLREQLRRSHSRLCWGSRATSLVRDSAGEIVGVDVISDTGPERLLARGGVVLATGGFSRSTELLERFAPEQLAGIPHGGAGNTGDGLRMAWAHGAGFRDMGYVSGTYGSHPDTGAAHELLTAFYMGAVIVNQAGERFVDESASYKTIGSACLQQPNGMGYQIFDARVRAQSQPGVPLSDIDHLEAKGRVIVADTLEQLGELAGIDPGTLVETVAAYNTAVADESADPVGRTHLCNGVGELSPLVTAPFYAYPAKTLMTSTYAGLTVSPRTEVLDVAGRVIPGLFAAGEVVGGFHGSAYMTGTALGKALIFGRIAGRAAAERLNPPAP